jgi:hypothetical protein
MLAVGGVAAGRGVQRKMAGGSRNIVTTILVLVVEPGRTIMYRGQDS